MDPQSEVLLVFALVESAIWLSEISKSLSWLFGASALLLVLRYWYRNFSKLKSIFHPAPTKRIYYGEMYVAFFACGTAILAIAEFGNPKAFALPGLAWRFAVSVLYYLGNALWQQTLLNGYFLPRLEQGFRNDKNEAVLAVGILFALVHLPNPVLVPVTMIGGMLCAYFFRKTGNIYALIVAHSILAVSIMYLFPESWHHHLRIGPGFLRWNP